MSLTRAGAFSAVLLLGLGTPAVAQVSPIPDDATVVYVSSQRLSTETNLGKAGLTRMQTLQRERALAFAFQAVAVFCWSILDIDGALLKVRSEFLKAGAP